MLVCSRCKKDLNNEKSANIFVVKPATLPTNGHQDYSLCRECGHEYHKRLSMLEDEYILGKKVNPQFITENGDTRVVLLESNKSSNTESDEAKNECNHEWYPVSCCNYDVEGCRGYICGNCGKLDCHCNIDPARIVDDMIQGNRYYELYKSR